MTQVARQDGPRIRAGSAMRPLDPLEGSNLKRFVRLTHVAEGLVATSPDIRVVVWIPLPSVGHRFPETKAVREL